MSGKYVFIFTGGGDDSSGDLDDEVMAAWMAWFARLGKAVVDIGNPFGSSAVVRHDGTVDDHAPSNLTGYAIVSAPSLSGALDMARGCPVLRGGGAVEVYEASDV